MDADRIVRDFCEHWARGDVEAIVGSFTDDAVYHNIPMAPCEGREAIRAFVGNLLGEMASRTAILISHRISTVREADRIFVLQDGRLVEQGAHDELVKRGGLYAEMFEKQQIMYRLERR